MPRDPDGATTDPFALRYGGAGPGSGLPVNAVIESLLAHRSVRAYRTDPLPPGTLEAAIAAAQSAASSSNLQTWSVVAIQDPARKARLAAIAANQVHIVQAPLFLVWLADLSRLARVAQGRNETAEGLPFIEMLIVAIVDAALAAQNAVAAVESLGLGTVYIGALRNDIGAVAAELGLPPMVLPLFGLCIGHPDEARPAAVKPRLPQAAVLSHERYDIAAEPRAITAYDAVMRSFQRDQGMAEESWTGRSMTRVRSARGLQGRDRLREALVALGFPLA